MPGSGLGRIPLWWPSSWKCEPTGSVGPQVFSPSFLGEGMLTTRHLLELRPGYGRRLKDTSVVERIDPFEATTATAEDVATRAEPERL